MRSFAVYIYAAVRGLAVRHTMSLNLSSLSHYPFVHLGWEKQVKVSAQGHNMRPTQGSNSRPWDHESRGLPLSYPTLPNFTFCVLANVTSMLSINGWQLAKMKRVFLTCPCHKMYRDEAVGLKSCKYTWKITIFVKMWNLGQYRENLIFCE